MALLTSHESHLPIPGASVSSNRSLDSSLWLYARETIASMFIDSAIGTVHSRKDSSSASSWHSSRSQIMKSTGLINELMRSRSGARRTTGGMMTVFTWSSELVCGNHELSSSPAGGKHKKSSLAAEWGYRGVFSNDDAKRSSDRIMCLMRFVASW